MTDGMWLVMFGTMLVAAGGLVATHGWNKHSSESDRIELVKTVIAEISANQEILRDSTFQDCEYQPGKATCIFPRLLDSALAGAIAKGSFPGAEGRKIVGQAIRLKQRLSMFNRKLEFAELLGSHDIKTTLRSYPAIRGPLRSGLQQELLTLRSLLETSYGIRDSDVPSVNLGVP